MMTPGLKNAELFHRFNAIHRSNDLMLLLRLLFIVYLTPLSKNSVVGHLWNEVEGVISEECLEQWHCYAHGKF